MAAPLFLLAPPRSYTSLMNAMLGQHPQAFGLPEMSLFNVEILGQLWIRASDEMGGTDAKTRHGLLRAVAEIYAGEQTMHSVRMAEHWCAAREHHSVASVYQELVAKIDPLVAVEKSPAYTIDVKRMRAIYKAFPDARFLHLTRHPVGQCKSVMNLYDGTFALFVNSIEFTARPGDPGAAIRLARLQHQHPQLSRFRAARAADAGARRGHDERPARVPRPDLPLAGPAPRRRCDRADDASRALALRLLRAARRAVRQRPQLPVRPDLQASQGQGSAARPSRCRGARTGKG